MQVMRRALATAALVAFVTATPFGQARSADHLGRYVDDRRPWHVRRCCLPRPPPRRLRAKRRRHRPRRRLPEQPDAAPDRPHVDRRRARTRGVREHLRHLGDEHRRRVDRGARPGRRDRSRVGAQADGERQARRFASGGRHGADRRRRPAGSRAHGPRRRRVRARRPRRRSVAHHLPQRRQSDQLRVAARQSCGRDGHGRGVITRSWFLLSAR